MRILLNNSYFAAGRYGGLVFLETETQFYILTYEEEMENLQELQVTFADGSTVQGEICRGDADSGFAVATVRKIFSMTVQEKVSWYLI